MSDRVVYKYVIPDGLELEVITGQPERVVLFGEQGGRFCVWIECRPANSKGKATFRVFATGEPIPHWAVHVGSCITHEGAGVWHLYRLDDWEWVS